MTINMEITPCSQSKKNIIVIGSLEHKRSIYFSKAARELGQSVQCIDWNDLRGHDLTDAMFVKVDPQPSMGAQIEQLPELIRQYHEDLNYLDGLKGVHYLNAPNAIWETLDKVLCKKRLVDKGIAVTDMIEGKASDYDAFSSMLAEQGICDVFIKPRYGSGAAGVMAYRRHPKLHQEIIYTSARLDGDGKLCNTKKMYKITDKDRIRSMLDQLLQQPVLVEKWIRKARHKGLSFDLRVVFQYGSMDFIVARGSKTPITNLHLTDGAFHVTELGLSENQMGKIETLCRDAAGCFPGLNIAGIDVLMTPSGQFKIIEVNGQGDLIYQDIFDQNFVYRRQIAEGMRAYGAGEERTSNRSE